MIFIQWCEPLYEGKHFYLINFNTCLTGCASAYTGGFGNLIIYFEGDVNSFYTAHSNSSLPVYTLFLGY